MLKWKYKRTKTNMSEQFPAPQKERKHEGPPRLLDSERVLDEQMLRETRYGKSFGQLLTESYGKEGVGWDFVVDVEANAENEISNTMTSAESAVANELRRNEMSGLGRTIEDEDGNVYGVEGKIENRTIRASLGRIVIYPEGDAYYAAYFGEESN